MSTLIRTVMRRSRFTVIQMQQMLSRRIRLQIIGTAATRWLPSRRADLPERVAAGDTEQLTQPLADDAVCKRRNIAMKAIEWIRRTLRSVAPYLAVGLFLPGGSIMALLL